MIIYNSMIIWIVVLGIWNKLVMQAQGETQRFTQKQRDYKVPMYLAILTFGYIIFWVGMRSGVADTKAYINSFNAYPSSLATIPQYWDFSENKSPGFITFSILFKHFISTDYHMWLMTIAILSGIPIMLILRKKSKYFFYSSFLFMTGLIFFWMLNGMRQFWAATIVFLFSDWIE
ncbi:EpsG family protein, partial [Faecalimonas umbilicata]